MTDKEYQLCQDLISIMHKYGAMGFVGTFYMKEQDGFTTLRIVEPGYNENPFKEVENTLVESVNKVFGAKEHFRENGYVKERRPNDEMPH
jgi:hypothetical protein